jgi:ABC-type multidrug transport system permease subunit
MFAALFTFPQEMGMLRKERSSDMYHLSAYYIAKTTSALPLNLFFPFLFVTIIYWGGGLQPQVRAAATAIICMY